ncbi:hypothetical protein TGARI_295420 [Toxoplasma gondii ARI]|uniref:Uncharacterized protein n=1 Tax=Toxoplasma gondii ARI TaxID=1074872 RepID=A0A139XJY4_TOXGO|nr:hypothetical protein TGARI_295420 [Toxoplasma gondii ARI]
MNQGGKGFSFGKPRESLILPRKHDSSEPEPPIRWMAIDFVCTPTAENLDIDVHAFVFTHDGEYVDCVFYKNPVLAGKGIRLQGTTLYLDLKMLPARAGFVVVTLAVYSGGALLDLKECSTEVRAYIPKDPLAASKTVAAGKLPSPEDHWEALLATMTITSSVIGVFPDAKGFLDCLLAEEDGNWFLKALMRPVAAFTPQVLIEPAQRAVLRYRSTVENGEDTSALPLGELLNSVKQGKAPPDLLPAKSDDDLSLQMGDFDRLNGGTDSETGTRDRRTDDTGSSDHGKSQWGGRGGERDFKRYSGGKSEEVPDNEDIDSLEEHRRHVELPHRGLMDILEEFMEPSEMEAASTEGDDARKFESPSYFREVKRTEEASWTRGEKVAGEAGGTRLREVTRSDDEKREGTERTGRADSQWKKGVEERLMRLEKGLTDVTRALQQVADGTKEMNVKMQKWFAVTASQLDKLQGGAGLPGGVPDPSGAASLQNLLQTVELDASTRGGPQDSVAHQLRTIDQRLTLGERNQQHISQTLSELKVQLAGVERRLGNTALGGGGDKPAVPQLVVDEVVVVDDGRQRTTLEDEASEEDEEMSTSQRKGVSRRWHRCFCRACCFSDKAGGEARSSRTPCGCSRERGESGDPPRTAGGRDFNDLVSRTETVLKNVEKIDHYGEELGDLLRCLASCTAPDGLKGLDPVERKLFAFAGTSKTFEALHTFETALDRLRVKGIDLLDSPRMQS